MASISEASARHPDWNALFEIATVQQGQFTTRQAAQAGYSPPLLVHHIHAGRIRRVRRGIYRLVHFPAGELEDLVTVWLWSHQAGVFSHQTALALHDLSDVLPEDLHLTLPASWRHRRFRVPVGVVLHHADIEVRDRAWVGVVPVTAPRRTLADCAQSGLSPELLVQAAQQALRRGLVARTDLAEVDAALAPFGGVPA